MRFLDALRVAFSSIGAKNSLNSKDVILGTVPRDSQYATIASTIKVASELEPFAEIKGAYRHNGWNGLDEASLQHGYLSHNGSNLRFHTIDAMIFDYALHDIRIQSHPLGLLLSTPDGEVVVGQSMPLRKVGEPWIDDMPRYRIQHGVMYDWRQQLGQLGIIL